MENAIFVVYLQGGCCANIFAMEMEVIYRERKQHAIVMPFFFSDLSLSLVRLMTFDWSAAFEIPLRVMEMASSCS